MANLTDAIRRLAKRRVYVGIPAENNARPGEAIGNAALAYIHEYGSPAQNIPARPFLGPGIKDAQPDIVKHLREAAEAALQGDVGRVEAGFHDAGAAAVNSVHMRIQLGIPPLVTEQTVRRSRTKARRTGTPGTVTPLYDTGDMLRSITYVIR